MDLHQRKVDHLNLNVPDIEKAVAFYTQVMHCEVLARYENGERRYAFVSNGTITYEMVQRPGVETAYMDHIAYVSEDIQADYATFKALDSTMVLGEIGYVSFFFENGMDFFFVQGPGGERIEFCQRR